MYTEREKLSDKWCLTIPEASKYFNIGEKKLRALISNNSEADYLFYNGVKCLIKRKKFEDFIDKSYSI